MRPFALHTSKANLWAKSKRVAIACSVTYAHQAIVYISITVILGYALFLLLSATAPSRFLNWSGLDNEQ